MNTEISPENVCHFITDHGGKVKNTVLVSHFKKLLNDPETKDEARQKFKECVNAVAVVKTEEGEKYVQLKKKYRTSTTTASSASEIPTDGSAAPSVTPVDSLKKPTEESTSSEKTGNSAHDNLPYVDGASENSNKSPSKKSQSLSSSSPAHDVTHKSKENLQHHSPKKDKTTSSTPADAHVSPEKQQKSSSHRKGSQTSVPPKTGSSEPASKTKDSPRKLSYTKADDTNRLSAKLSTDGSGFTAPTSVPLRKKKEKKENVPPSPIPEHRLTSIDRIKPSLQNIPSDQGGRGRSRVVSMIQGSYAGAVERVRQNFQSKTKNEDAASIALSERSLDSKGEEQDDDEDRHIPSVVLDINEKAWIIQSSRGNMVEMRKLLNIESSLADKKDFVMGYTALHWAAKKGNIDMVHMLLDQKVEINPRSNGGYTPLHFAAMHGHENVITLLLEADADANIRDFSGKQAIHYLKSISLPLQSKNTYNNIPRWKYHFHTGARYTSPVSEEVIKFLADKTGPKKVVKLESERWHGVQEDQEGCQRVNSFGSGEHKPTNSNNGGSRGKVSRTESMLMGMGLRRKSSFRKSKVLSKTSEGSTEVGDYISSPISPMMVKPTPSSGLIQWKPAGPRN